MAEREYLFKAEWRDEKGDPVPGNRLRRAFRRRMPVTKGPWRWRWLRDGEVVRDFGNYHRRRSAIREMISQLRHRPVGDVLQIEAKNGPDYRTRIALLEPELSGRRVLMAVRSVWGAPYIFGAQNEPGDTTPGVAFDCSGLVGWAYEFVGIDLPHSSDAILNDARVTLFNDRSLCRPGDLVLMHFGRLAPGHADHVGVWKDDDVMLDTRSPYDPVGRSSIEPFALMHYGRIVSVNGPLTRR